MNRRNFGFLALGVLLALVAMSVLIASVGDDSDGSRAPAARAPMPVVALDADGPSFPDLATLQSSAELIVTGVPLSRKVSEIPGGEGLPQTVYTVRVDDVLQGDVSLVKRDVMVATLGGAHGGKVYEAHGLRTLVTGDRYVFFLARGDGKGYFPLGGAALGALKADGSFTLSADVTTGTGLTAKVADMVCKGTVVKGRYEARTRGRAARRHYTARTAKRIGRRKATRYAVKLVRGCRVIATGSAKDKLLILTVKPLSASGKTPRYPRLKGSYTLRYNGGPAAIPTVRVVIR
jgi:hypothetical protein